MLCKAERGRVSSDQIPKLKPWRIGVRRLSGEVVGRGGGTYVRIVIRLESARVIVWGCQGLDLTDVEDTAERPTELYVDGVEGDGIQHSPEICIWIDALRRASDVVPEEWFSQIGPRACMRHATHALSALSK